MDRQVITCRYLYKCPHGFTVCHEKIGISRQAVSKWERAEESPDTENLILLAWIYNVSIDELLKTQEPVEPAESFNEDVAEDFTSANTERQDEEQAGDCVRKRFHFRLIVVAIYLLIGYFTNRWHPAWIIFLTIPIYDWITSGSLRRR